MLCLGGLWVGRVFVWPIDAKPGRVDAVVALAGAPERVELALRLVERGIADWVVLSRPVDGDDGGPPCGAVLAGGATVLCIEPDPSRTSGEAAALGRLAAERGWSSVAAVSSRTHLPRARLLLRQCFDGRVTTVSAGYTAGRWRVPLDVLEEIRDYVAALTIDRAC